MDNNLSEKSDLSENLGEPNLDSLEQMAADPDPEVRGRLAATLGCIDGDRAFSLLVGMLSDTDMRVRATAAMAIGQQKNPHAARALLPLLDEGSTQMTCTAIAALAHLGDERSFAPIVSRLFDANDEIRQNAAGAIGALRDPRALEPLKLCLQDPVEWVRANSALSLGKIGCFEVVGDLIELADSNDTVLVRANAVSAVGLIALDNPNCQDTKEADIAKANEIEEKKVSALEYVLDVMSDEAEDQKVRIAAMLAFTQSFAEVCKICSDIAASAFCKIESIAKSSLDYALNDDTAVDLRQDRVDATDDTCGEHVSGDDIQSTSIWCLGQICKPDIADKVGISNKVIDEVFDILSKALYCKNEWCVRYSIEALANMEENRCAEVIRDFSKDAPQTYLPLCACALANFRDNNKE